MKACSQCSLFLETTNLKRTVTPQHGAVWGVDNILNYLKEINNASGPWRVRSAGKATHGYLGKVALQSPGLSQHPEFQRKIHEFEMTDNKGKVEVITPLPLGAGNRPRKLFPGGSSLTG